MAEAVVDSVPAVSVIVKLEPDSQLTVKTEPPPAQAAKADSVSPSDITAEPISPPEVKTEPITPPETPTDEPGKKTHTLSVNAAEFVPIFNKCKPGFVGRAANTDYRLAGAYVNGTFRDGITYYNNPPRPHSSWYDSQHSDSNNNNAYAGAKNMQGNRRIRGKSNTQGRGGHQPAIQKVPRERTRSAGVPRSDPTGGVPALNLGILDLDPAVLAASGPSHPKSKSHREGAAEGDEENSNRTPRQLDKARLKSEISAVVQNNCHLLGIEPLSYQDAAAKSLTQSARFSSKRTAEADTGSFPAFNAAASFSNTASGTRSVWGNSASGGKTFSQVLREPPRPPLRRDPVAQENLRPPQLSGQGKARTKSSPKKAKQENVRPTPAPKQKPGPPQPSEFLDLAELLFTARKANKREIPAERFAQPLAQSMDSHAYASEKKKGRTREKPKRPTALKKLILAERELRRNDRMEKSTSAPVSRFNLNASCPGGFWHAALCASETSDISKGTDCDRHAMTTGLQQVTGDDDDGPLFRSLHLEDIETDTDAEFNDPGDDDGSQPPEPFSLNNSFNSMPLSLSDLGVPSFCGNAKLQIHTRRFREYCDHSLSKDIDSCVSGVLKLLVKFQNRVYQNEPEKYQYKKRFVLGLREVMKHVELRHVKCCLIAPNIERGVTNSCLDLTIEKIIVACQKQGVPYVFCLNRNGLGRAVCKRAPVSVVAILNQSGAEEFYLPLLKHVTEARQEYQTRLMAAMAEEENAVTPSASRSAPSRPHQQLCLEEVASAALIAKDTEQVDNST